ncbi:hypothetical protein BDQ12DRAFT_705474 [Crucibulum laeve]|uniref:BTB domain-containing protein n=1 Tax=Crucibulum laeve TaxID=68775 RepID=A0A5C3LZY8_9AGAR|nr:hypothetical protein BDQ12DRAFT_705474 [Crucibulum laeve]
MDPEEKKYSVSEKFHAPNADVIIRSSDNMHFHIHRKYLEANTGAFPPSEFETGKDEVVALTESSVTLELLFSFIYPQRYPELEDVPFEIIEPLAEAAEKYEVFSAMYICHLRMKDFIPTNPTEVLSYACRHDYPLVISAAAEVAIALPLAESVRLMPPYLVMPWILYVDAWMKVYRNVQEASTHLDYGHTLFFIDQNANDCCGEWAHTVLSPISKRLVVGYSALGNLDALFSVKPTRDCCCNALTDCKEMIEREVKTIPKFKHFISNYK